MTVEKPKPKQLLRPITTGAGSAMNQSQFLEILCNSLQAREKSCVHGAIGLGFASLWLKNWRESFMPIAKRSNRDHVITIDSHLKTALYLLFRLFKFKKPAASRKAPRKGTPLSQTICRKQASQQSRKICKDSSPSACYTNADQASGGGTVLFAINWCRKD